MGWRCFTLETPTLCWTRLLISALSRGRSRQNLCEFKTRLVCSEKAHLIHCSRGVIVVGYRWITGPQSCRGMGWAGKCSSVTSKVGQNRNISTFCSPFRRLAVIFLMSESPEGIKGWLSSQEHTGVAEVLSLVSSAM